MIEAIGGVLPFAAAIAISPMPIIAIILILMSDRAKTLGLSFAGGWFVGAFVVTWIFSLIAGVLDGQESDDSSKPIQAVIKIVLGLLLGYLALKKWNSRPQAGEEPSLPKWMESMTSMKPLAAIGLALLLVAVNPKNMMMEAAAGLEIGQQNLGVGSLLVVLLVFTILASITVLGPVVFYFVAPKKAASALAGVREWLVENNATIMVVLFAIFAVKLIGDGLKLF